jgi:hypothetical protein
VSVNATYNRKYQPPGRGEIAANVFTPTSVIAPPAVYCRWREAVPSTIDDTV